MWQVYKAAQSAHNKATLQYPNNTILQPCRFGIILQNIPRNEVSEYDQEMPNNAQTHPRYREEFHATAYSRLT